MGESLESQKERQMTLHKTKADLFYDTYGRRELSEELAERALRSTPTLFLDFLEEAIEMLKPFELSCAAEVIGRSPESLPLLSKLLEHHDATVREGAVLGLANRDDARAVSLLRQVAGHDQSAAVRQVAREFIEERP